MLIRKLVAVLALLLAASTPAHAENAPTLDPEKTYAFFASIVKWPASAGLATFSDERKDGALVSALNVAGVSSKNIVFLTDEKATLAAMRKELRALATRAGEGSTLIFSFQGHGGKHGGKTFLMNYDVKDDVEQTAFGVHEIGPLLDECFRGERLLLLGDCCHSGALGEVVAHFEKSKKVKAASFTSATASNRSTEHWTFTEAVIDALLGDGRLDRDHDGAITFAETDRWVREVMKYREGQLTRAARTSTFEEAFALRKVKKAVADLPGDIEVGDYVDALDREKKWWLAEVEGFEDGKYLVHYLGWDRKWDEAVDATRVRPPKAPQLEVGARYEVEWDAGEWFPGTITRAEEGWFFFVHYEGENGDDDEWITAGRARKPSAPEYLALAPRAAKKGDAVVARWRQAWYAAKVTRVEKNLVHVRYSDGSKARVTKEELIVLADAKEIAEGERVLAGWKNESRMYPGTVTKKNAKTVTVAWEDGSDPSEVELSRVARVKK